MKQPAERHDTQIDTELRTQMVFSEYEERIFNLALNLIGDEDTAALVVDRVYSRLTNELCRHPHEQLEILIHRFTYDAALPLLLQQVQENCDGVDACCTWITGEKRSILC